MIPILQPNQSPSFINGHLSYSRLTRFETCPLSFKFHYIDKLESKSSIAPMFGQFIHTVLERLLLEIKYGDRRCTISKDRAYAIYREEWTNSGLYGLGLYQEGLEIIENFIRDQGLVNPESILAIEEEFEFQVGKFKIMGFIDRVDIIDFETIEIIDYKTNRMLFTQDEVDSSLQMSLYQAVAKQLWPWAKNIKLTFWMLRHSIRQQTSRTQKQIDAALAYAEALGNRTESAKDYPARLNPNCCYCDHQEHCPAYSDALKGKRDFISDDLADLESVARQREEAACLAKIIYARKEQLDSVLKAHLKEKKELVLGGKCYRMFNMVS